MKNCAKFGERFIEFLLVTTCGISGTGWCVGVKVGWPVSKMPLYRNILTVKSLAMDSNFDKGSYSFPDVQDYTNFEEFEQQIDI